MSSPSSRDERAAESDRITVLPFSLGGTRYCVRVDAIESVVGVAKAGLLENAADPWAAGSTAVDGTRVRVVDLLRVIEPARSRTDDPTLLVCRETDERGAHYGWVVGTVDSTETVRTDDVVTASASAQFIEGRIERPDGAVIWLNDREING
ncbi:chemotaxis protein CheW [Natrarchaeobius halalkaliphilus]|uniref:Chemotaxis protein CheW n=1 Tax=Natrarchaeobius halalkaliphilus TaxID=1679091 RepID=A0A3N6LQ03_9EURY|nr:chemotaxis protein CheW [Natrarchaeobius halalkaliphilus]RQG90297.1 chemotaxis protein CheW [Natrarchaeobius halalkaliphilus]